MVLSFIKKVNKEIKMAKILERENEGTPIRKIYSERITKLQELKIDVLLKQIQANLDKRFVKANRISEKYVR